jgi:MraZ protein
LIFRGTFEHSLDAKHRLTVPARYRAALAAGAVLAVSPETEPGAPRSVAIWIPEDYEAYTTAALAELNPLSPRARDLKRFFFNNSHEAELDSANRLMIPAPLISYAGLDKEVVVTGSGECLEIWDRAAHAGYNEGVLSRFTEIVASFDHTA